MLQLPGGQGSLRLLLECRRRRTAHFRRHRERRSRERPAVVTSYVRYVVKPDIALSLSGGVCANNTSTVFGAFATLAARLADERVVDTPYKSTYWTHRPLHAPSFRFRLTNRRARPTHARHIGPNEL